MPYKKMVMVYEFTHYDKVSGGNDLTLMDEAATFERILLAGDSLWLAVRTIKEMRYAIGNCDAVREGDTLYKGYDHNGLNRWVIIKTFDGEHYLMKQGEIVHILYGER